jgi:hypothetical protein
MENMIERIKDIVISIIMVPAREYVVVRKR